MKKLILIVLLAFLTSGCAAMRSKQYWAGVAIKSAAAVVDAESQQRCQRVDPTCTEGNPLFGSKQPTRPRMYAIGFLTIAAESGVVALIWRKNESYGKAVNWLSTGLRVTLHGFAIGSNLSVKPAKPVCPSGTTCP